MIRAEGLHVVAAGGLAPADVAKAAVAGGAAIVQFRDKACSDREAYAIALELREITRGSGALFVVNDRVDIALAVGADGAHVGQDDLPAATARRLLGADCLLGVSARTVGEMRAAVRDGADYVGFGPVFDARRTKSDAGEPVGLDDLARVVAECSVPVVAIGGIGPWNAARVLAAGVRGIAVVSAVAGAPDMERVTRDLAAVVQRTRGPAALGPP